MKKLILVVLLISLFLLTGCSDYEKRYEKLQEEYDELLTKYDSINSSYFDNKEEIGFELDRITDSIGSLEDDIATVWCYFENEEDVTLKFRVRRPVKDVKVVIESGGEKIQEIIKPVLIPSEMTMIKLNKDKLSLIKGDLSVRIESR